MKKWIIVLILSGLGLVYADNTYEEPPKGSVKKQLESMHNDIDSLRRKIIHLEKEIELIETHLEEVKEFIEKNYFKDHAKM
jgi:peptidoglycan hydrolase CwlO-like protein